MKEVIFDKKGLVWQKRFCVTKNVSCDKNYVWLKVWVIIVVGGKGYMLDSKLYLTKNYVCHKIWVIKIIWDKLVMRRVQKVMCDKTIMCDKNAMFDENVMCENRLCVTIESYVWQ
jgi:hypothetical protein